MSMTTEQGNKAQTCTNNWPTYSFTWSAHLYIINTALKIILR